MLDKVMRTAKYVGSCLVRAGSHATEGRVILTFQVVGKLPFDKLRANGQAFSFALSREPIERSKGKFAPNLKHTRKAGPF
jgi:hypothetical protein